MRYVAYRNLIGVTHTEAQAKAEAEAITVNKNSKFIRMMLVNNKKIQFV